MTFSEFSTPSGGEYLEIPSTHEPELRQRAWVVKGARMGQGAKVGIVKEGARSRSRIGRKCDPDRAAKVAQFGEIAR